MPLLTVYGGLIFRLNGGPGASSMTGMMTEMGAYSMQQDGTLLRNPHGWNHLGHLLSFDQPVGTGYSSVHAEPGSTEGYVDSQEMMAAQLYTGLQRFFDAHPELVSNPFYVAGESYGKYTEQCLTKPGILSFTKPESPNANSRKVHPQHKLFDTCEESHGR